MQKDEHGFEEETVNPPDGGLARGKTRSSSLRFLALALSE
jgi:hypothetical protein